MEISNACARLIMIVDVWILSMSAHDDWANGVRRQNRCTLHNPCSDNYKGRPFQKALTAAPFMSPSRVSHHEYLRRSRDFRFWVKIDFQLDKELARICSESGRRRKRLGTMTKPRHSPLLASTVDRPSAVRILSRWSESRRQPHGATGHKQKN